MKNNSIFRLFTGLFRRKDRQPDPRKRSFDEVFSYTMGPPDDEVTREAFRLLRERVEKEKAKEAGCDNEDKEPEPPVQSLDEGFSYIIGEPCDDLLKESFRRLKEWDEREKAKEKEAGCDNVEDPVSR